MEKKQSGYVVYQGPSMINGAAIVAILTTKTKNPKTGDMAQLWILPATIAPHEAIKTGLDAAVCGDCKHRRGKGGSCYVTPHQGPLSVYRAWQRGNYEDASGLQSIALIGAGLTIRLGAYGDPAALPESVVTALLLRAEGWTGYTHQWRSVAADWLKAYCMASVDDESEAGLARAMGWRYFRVRAEDETMGQREFLCPASDEGGNRTDCRTCQACNGASKGAAKASPVIVVHGSMASRFTQGLRKGN